MTPTNKLLGWEAYERLLTLLRACPDSFDGDETGPDPNIIVAQDDDAIYVAADPCIWRFTRDDGIHTNSRILTVPLIMGLHEGKPWVADARQPSKQVDGNPVLTVWNNAIEAATRVAADTHVIQRFDNSYVRIYGHLLNLDGQSLVIDDDFMWIFAGVEGVQFKASKPSECGLVVSVGDEPVAVIMPIIPVPGEPRTHIWDRFDALVGRQAVSS